MGNSEGQKIETPELDELVDGEIPEGKRVVRLGKLTSVSVYPEKSESPSEALKNKLKVVKPDWPTHYIQIPFSSYSGYAYVVQFLRLEDDPDIVGKLKELQIYANKISDILHRD